MEGDTTPHGTADESAALEEVLEERNRFWHEAQRAHALEHDLEHTRRVLTEMQASFSWRLTAPLRDAKNRVGPYARAAEELARKARARLRG